MATKEERIEELTKRIGWNTEDSLKTADSLIEELERRIASLKRAKATGLAQAVRIEAALLSSKTASFASELEEDYRAIKECEFAIEVLKHTEA